MPEDQMSAHELFNVQVWDLRSQGLSVKEISDQASLEPTDVIQRLSFDGFNQYRISTEELEEVGLEWTDIHEHGIEIFSEAEDV